MSEQIRKKKKRAEKDANHIIYNHVKIPYPKPRKLQSLNGDPLYCVCREVDNGELMVGCDNCDDWYHFKCLNLDRRAQKLYYKFYCPYCEILNADFVSVFKKKCMVSECYEPISEGSKFCSRNHGLVYFERIKTMLSQQESRAASALKPQEIAAILAQVPSAEIIKSAGRKLPEVEKSKFDSFLKNEDYYDEYVSELAEIDAEVLQNKVRKDYYILRKQYLDVLITHVETINEYLASLSNPDESKPKSRSKSKNFSKKFEICGYDTKFSMTLRQLEQYLADQNEFFATKCSKKDEGGSDKDESKQESDESSSIFANSTVADQEYFSKQLATFKKMFTSVESLKDFQDSPPLVSPVFPGLCLNDGRKCVKHEKWRQRLALETTKRLEDLQREHDVLTKNATSVKSRYYIQYWETEEENAVAASASAKTLTS